MKAYKGFNKDMTCRGFQFEEGKTYEEPEAKLCECGFHACEDPMDCLRYYDVLNGVVHEVDLDGISDERHKEDTKICARKVTVGARLDINGIVAASIDFVMKSVKIRGGKEKHNDDGKNYAQLASSGYGAKLASSGDYAKLASSGDYAKLASSGYGAKLASSGDYAQLDLQGENGVGAVLGINGKIRGKVGDWITLAEWKRDSGKWVPVCVRSTQIDGETIKTDTWYTLNNGEFTEADNDP